MKRGIVLGVFILCFFIFGILTGCDDPEPEIPAIPGGVTAAVDGDGIRVSWNPVSGAESYVIYRLSSEDGEVNIGTAPGQQTSSFSDTAGTSTPPGVPGTSYTYAVAARNSAGTSEKSSWSTPARVFPGNVVVPIPAVPTIPTTVVQSPSSITIRWNPSEGAVGYKVYRDTTSDGNFENLVSGSTPWTGTSFTDEGLQANTDYFYRVSAVNSSGGESEKSTYVQGKTIISPEPPEIDFNSYFTTNDYAFIVTSHASQNLIAFKGSLQNNNIVGGIPARANAHGIKNNTEKFPSSQGFVLILLTEEQYYANEHYLANPLIIPYARIFVAYNRNGTNEKVYEINSHSGGDFTIQVHNSTGMNVELRRDGIHGIPVGLAPDGMDNVTFYVDSGDYMLYPVFMKYNSLRDELSTVYPKFNDGTALRAQITLDPGGRNQIFPLMTLLEQDYTFSTGTAHLIIKNDFIGGSVDLQIGLDRVLNLWGTYGIRSGEERTFPILMTKIADNRYSEDQSISTYSIGQTDTREFIGNYRLELDKVYRVTVSGTNITNLQVSEPELIGTIDLSDFD